MPPLSHGAPERQHDPELRESIAKIEQSICSSADAIVQKARREEYNQLTGLKAALHRRKPVSTQSVRYETAEHDGNSGIRTKLVDNGSKEKDTVSLLTKVVADIKHPFNDDVLLGEVSVGDWVERIRFSGNKVSGYDMTICDVNTQILTPGGHLSLLQAIKQTVDLIGDHQFLYAD